MKSRRMLSTIMMVLLLFALSLPPAIASSATFLPLGRGTPFTYNGIPFQVNGVSLFVYKSGFGFVPAHSIDLTGYITDKIHILETAGWADNISDGVTVGHINIHYADGSSETLDLVMGKNIAEWAYDRPEVQPYLKHSKVPPAYSFWTNLDSRHFYWGHLFYVSMDTRERPLARLELALDPRSYTGQRYYGMGPADWFGITIGAVTLERRDSSLLITGLSAEPTQFDPYEKDGETTIDYVLSKDCSVSIQILDSSGKVVKKSLPRIGEAPGSTGSNTVVWNGVIDFPELNKGTVNSDDLSVFLAPDGTYTIKVMAKDEANPSITDTKEVKVRAKTSW